MRQHWHRTALFYHGQALYVNVQTGELAAEDHGEYLVSLGALHPDEPGCNCQEQLREFIVALLRKGVPADEIGPRYLVARDRKLFSRGR